MRVRRARARVLRRAAARRLLRRRAGVGRRRRDKPAISRAAKAAKPENITLWVGFEQRELGVIKQAVEAVPPRAPARSTSRPSAASPTTRSSRRSAAATRPTSCSRSAPTTPARSARRAAGSTSSPTWSKDKISADEFPKPVQSYTQYKGTRCALPMLADTYGLYYNKKLFEKAGITSPPKTMSELTADAKKLTTRDADGQPQGRRLRPGAGLLRERARALRAAVRRRVGRRRGQVLAVRSPGWTEFLNWQKGLDRLLRLRQAAALAGRRGRGVLAAERVRARQAGDEHGRRVPHRVHQGRAPGARLRHRADAGRPTAIPSSTARATSTGNIIGIPKSAKHKDAAWQLVKYLTTDDHALALLSNGLRNVPTTTASLKSSRARARPAVQGLHGHLRPPEDGHHADHRRRQREPGAFQNYVVKHQAGKVPDLQAALAKARQADRRAARQVGGAGGAVSVTRVAEPVPRRRRRPADPAGPPPGGLAARRLVLLLMSPWIVGFTVFFGYPLLASLYLSFTHYDLLSSPRWVGTANYRFMVHARPAVLAGRAATRCG